VANNPFMLEGIDHDGCEAKEKMVALKLYYHPLASFCHKVLVPLYEKGIPFEPVIVDFGNPDSAAAFKAIWPMAKMPVLVDEARAATVAESTIVIEYLEAYYPGAIRLIPHDHEQAWRVRFWDRFFDHYVHEPMQRIVADELRPQGKRDPFGVEQAKGQIVEAYDFIERQLEGRTWITGDEFTLADCAALPGLFYLTVIVPFGDRTLLSAYYRRLMTRPAAARVLEEAEPYLKFFPLPDKPSIVPLGR
jgi:glutathione S-transferase